MCLLAASALSGVTPRGDAFAQIANDPRTSAEVLSDLQSHPHPQLIPVEVAALEDWRLSRPKFTGPENATVTNAVRSASVTARCAKGFVTANRHSASSSAVRITAEHFNDCEGSRCRAYEVNAKRDDSTPFSLTASVTCAS